MTATLIIKGFGAVCKSKKDAEILERKIDSLCKRISKSHNYNWDLEE